MQVIAQLGKGSFGAVWRCRSMTGNFARLLSHALVQINIQGLSPLLRGRPWCCEVFLLSGSSQYPVTLGKLVHYASAKPIRHEAVCIADARKPMVALKEMVVPALPSALPR